MKNIGAIILAAGKGSRMQSKDVNKVAMPLADKPMIVHTIELLEKLSIKNIVVVVGFAKTSVMNVLGQKVLFAEQAKRLGTGHALLCGMKKIPPNVEHIIVLNGDDSAFYTKEIIENLVQKHLSSNSSLTLLTLTKKEPAGLGRIVRDPKGALISVVEEKDADEKTKLINEINPGCYIFKTDFLKKYLGLVKKSPISGEYYITSLVDIGIKHNELIETVNAGDIPWRGVNTKEELFEAEKLLKNKTA